MTNSRQGKESQVYERHPFILPLKELYHYLDTNSESGLDSARVQAAQKKYELNKLHGEGGVRWYAVLGKQISNAMILVLVLAMALSYGVTDYIEGGVITAVIFLNVAIGFYQEFQAEKKMDSLRALASPSASVIRNGHVETIPSAEAVPGDIAEFKVGDTIPADARLIESMNLECDEKILTGEAVPVAKDSAANFKGDDEASIGIGDRINMVYSSSTVTKGRGIGVIVFTGMSTEIGKIAVSMQGKTRKPNRSMSQKHGVFQPPKGAALRVWDGLGSFLGLTTGTPLQRKLNKLAYLLFLGALILAVIVFGVNRFNVTNEVAIYAISTGIAIIPESLLAVLTITMVVGMTQMRKRHVVIRQLSALEALGGVTNICSDKTGTLTQGQMVVRKVWLPGSGMYTVEGSEKALDPTSGSVVFEKANSKSMKTLGAKEVADVPSNTSEENEKSEPGAKSNPTLTPHLSSFLESSALCNLARVRFDEEKKEWQSIGDPTEIALQIYAHRFQYSKKTLEEVQGWKEVAEYPFDSSLKRMSVIYQAPEDGSAYVMTKGAVEFVLDRCTNIRLGDQIIGITEARRDQILRHMTMLADQGLRILAVAQRNLDKREAIGDVPRDDVESKLTLLGLAGLYDPPRLETKDAISSCATAGIKVHMLTGDHPSTATAIAREVGILPHDFHAAFSKSAPSMVSTAMEIDKMTDSELDTLPTIPLVIARCAPSTKTRIVHALHRRKCFVAMTGDGVNDAPSLQAADVGIAMGLTGSDVAKGASSMVLVDDNFASIVNAIEEGRRMFDNIQKFILHLLTGNVGEVILLIAGLGFQDATGSSVFPLSPLAILWINMLTSSMPAFGLGRERASANIMRRKPHDGRRGVFTLQIIVDLFVYGTIMGALTLLSFVIIVYGAGTGELGQDCNKRYSPSCTTVFRARAAVFVELTWLILISAWEFKSLRRSMLTLGPKTLRDSKVPFFENLYDNKVLFYSVVVGAASVFPAVYIPGLNRNVFKHSAIGWEWGLAVGAVVVFVIGVEGWKGLKRELGWLDGVDHGEEEVMEVKMEV